MRKGLPLPLGLADGNRRSLVGVDNLADLVATALTHPKAAGQIFMVSDGNDVSTRGLIRGLARAMGRPARLVPIPVGLLRMAGRLAGKRAAVDRLLGNLQVDISKTREMLGWSPPVSFEDGLERAVRQHEGA